MPAPILRVGRISLPDDKFCPNPDHDGYCHCGTKTGGDHLYLTVDVYSPCHLRVAVEVRFEGMYIHNLIPTVLAHS